MSDSQWTPTSWQSKPVAQPVVYPDEAKLNNVISKISHLPPLVTPSEIERLRHQLAQVQRNEAFLLHAGDCAESFDACTHQNITAKIGLILSFSLVLIWGARVPVVRVGRIAGQYAKPRSSATEKIGDREVPSFRGDNVNGLSTDDRTPDPERLLSAYFHSTTTLNYMRGLLTSGFASLNRNNPRDWSLAHVRSANLRKEYKEITAGLASALDFTRTIGLANGQDALPFERGGGRGALGEVDIYTSHEGLMLPYETALTRKFPIPGVATHASSAAKSRSASRAHTPSNEDDSAYYNTSAHFIWIGDRTRQIDGAHVEYFRGIRNPIGIKVGPSMKSEELIRLLDIVNPDREEGRVSLITRYGAGKIDDFLPAHIAAVQKSDHPVAWVCDPMHGNTQTTPAGIKTRNFGTIISELTSCLRIHAECGSRMNGVSLEFTGEVDDAGFSVTECLGGSMELSEEELGLRYQSFCDPRLNFEQSLDVAFLVSNYFKNARTDVSGDAVFQALGGRVPRH
ncbi:unnamed protein product [Peniophora sp. CBMAI 1063]|nr:unnamed protein product [Peniophora sp. CBMAI 1063]